MVATEARRTGVRRKKTIHGNWTQKEGSDSDNYGPIRYCNLIYANVIGDITHVLDREVRKEKTQSTRPLEQEEDLNIRLFRVNDDLGEGHPPAPSPRVRAISPIYHDDAIRPVRYLLNDPMPDVVEINPPNDRWLYKFKWLVTLYYTKANKNFGFLSEVARCPYANLVEFVQQVECFFSESFVISFLLLCSNNWKRIRQLIDSDIHSWMT